MAVTKTWSVLDLTRETSDGYVSVVRWKLTGTEGDKTVESTGKTYLTETVLDNFICDEDKEVYKGGATAGSLIYKEDTLQDKVLYFAEKDSVAKMKKAAMKLKKDSVMMMKKAAMKMKKVSAMKLKMKKK